MRIMMIQLPHIYDGTRRPPTLYPLGIGYMVSILKKKHELIPLDLWMNEITVPEAMNIISKDIPEVFCISVYSTQYPYFKELINNIKTSYPEKIIIAGGPGATFSYNVFLEKTPLDYCVIGEGERTISELLDNLTEPEQVKGIAYKKNGKIIATPPNEQIASLDTLPFPDRDFFDIEKYITNGMKETGAFHNKRKVNFIAGRGCPYQCTFCSKTFTSCRIRSVESIAEELKFLKKKYNIEAIDFNDELVVLNKKRTLQLCAIMKELGLYWGCQGRINLVDEEILRAMKNANCLYIGYGVESYSQDILNNMKKDIKLEKIVPVIKMTNKIGLTPLIQYMYGFPGENDETNRNTEKFFAAIDHPYMGFTTTPIPGTELYAQAISKGLIVDEEEYLTKLTSGYNSFEPLVNMTDYTNEQFIIKKREVMRKVNIQYYKKHPIIFGRKAVKKLWNLYRKHIIKK